MHPTLSCNGIISLMNDSFACHHYPLMKMSDLYDFKGRILQKTPAKITILPPDLAKIVIVGDVFAKRAL